MSSVMSLSGAKRELIKRYLSRGAAPIPAAHRITPRPAGVAVPLSLSQEQLLLRETSTLDISPLYNECIALRMFGPLDVPAMKRSLTSIIRRHEIWRTSYDTCSGRPVQVVHTAPEEIPLDATNLRSVSTLGQEAEAQRVIAELVRQPFDLKEGPLLRFRLLRFGDVEHRLFVIAHLSIVDGISAYRVLPSELAALYGAYSSGQPSPLSHLAVQFGDYAYWQRGWMQEEELAKQVAYWRRQLAGKLPVLSWPTDRPPTTKPTFRGVIRPFALPTALSEAVKELSKQEGVTLFMTLLAAFATLLFVYTEQDDIIVGTPSPAGRKRPEVQKLLGYFLNPVALRFDLSGNPTFRDLLRQAQNLTLEAISNDDVPLELLAQEFQAETDHRRNPFFTVAMSLQPPMPQVDLDWCVTTMDVESGGSPWDLYVAFIDRLGGITGRIQYNPDLFETKTIVHTLLHFQSLLGNLSANPGKRLSEARRLLGDTACMV